MRSRPIIAALLLLLASRVFASSEPLSRDEQQVFDHEERLATEIISHAKQTISSLQPQLMELESRMHSEFANKDVAYDCPGPVDDPLAIDSHTDCAQLLSQYKKCTAKKFDVAALEKALDGRIADFREAERRLDDLAAAWAQRRKQVRDQMIGDRARLGDAAPAVRRAIPQIEQEENNFYTTIDNIVLWEFNLVWELEIGEIKGMPVRDRGSGPNQYEVTYLPGEMQLKADQAKIAVADSHRELFQASCKWGVVNWRWSIDGSGSQAENDAAAVASRSVWMKCREAEDRERDSAGPALRAMRDQLIDERNSLRSGIDAWRKFCTSGHYYNGDGAAAVDAVYANQDAVNLHRANLPGRFFSAAFSPLNVGAGRDPGSETAGDRPQTQTQLPNDCWSGFKMALNGEAYPPDAQIKFPDIETSPFEFEVNLERPLDLNGVISGAADTERP